MIRIIYIAALTACILAAAESPRTFSGTITDTMCGSKPHSAMMKDKTAAECVRLCAHGPNEFALFDGSAVIKLSDQKTAAKYAGQRVRVTGTYDEKNKTIKATSIQATNGQ